MAQTTQTAMNIEDVIVQRVTELSATYKLYTENATGKSASYEDMTVADALQTIEATGNYDFASSEVYYYDVVTNTYTIHAATSEGVISGDEILNVYDEVFNYTTENVTAGRILIVSDMETDTEASTESNTVFTLTITTAVPDEEAGKQAACDFGSTDYWYPLFDDGKCDIYAPAYADVKDGLDVLQSKLGCSLSWPSCSGATSLVWYDINTIEGFYQIYPDGGEYEAYIFYADDCFDPTVLNNHKSGMIAVTNSYIPTGKIVKARITDFGVWDGGSPSSYSYEVDAVYAKYTCSQNGN